MTRIYNTFRLNFQIIDCVNFKKINDNLLNLCTI